MTLRSIVAIALYLPSAPVQAQPEFHLAAKSGVSISDVTRSPDGEATPHHRYGFSGGLAGHVQWPFADRLSLGGQLDLLYTQRGTDAFYNGELFFRNRYHYFDAALAIRPQMRFGSVRVYTLLGGGWNIRLKASQLDPDSNMERDVTKLLRRHDAALVIGAGVAVQLPHQVLRLNTIFLEARHDRGLINTDIVNDANKNRTGSLMLGLSFVLRSAAE